MLRDALCSSSNMAQRVPFPEDLLEPTGAVHVQGMACVGGGGVSKAIIMIGKDNDCLFCAGSWPGTFINHLYLS